MQQRGVIITAIVLALILAGALWYTLSRQQDVQEVVSPLPTPTEAVFEVPPQESPEPLLSQEEQLAESPQPPIATTAQTGTEENIIIFAAVVSLVGLGSLLAIALQARKN